MTIPTPTDLPSALATASTGAAGLQAALLWVEANGVATGLPAEAVAEIAANHHLLFHIAARIEAITGATAGSLSNPLDGTPKC